MNEKIRVISGEELDENKYPQKHVGCVVLTSYKKILLQYRPKNWWTFPDRLATFGGAVEKSETPIDALVRELHEELGAKINTSDVVSLGSITESITNYSELIYAY